MSTPRFLLASQSPRRRQMLKDWGCEFDVLPNYTQQANEQPFVGEDPDLYVRRVALAKLRNAVKVVKSPLPILTADTTVTLGGSILGKPANAEIAFHQLAALSGKTHRVLTAVALAVSGQEFIKVVRTDVTFKILGEQEIRAYIATGEPLDKAGSYGIQGRAGAFVKHLSGSYTAVVGLPQFETFELLALAGIPLF